MNIDALAGTGTTPSIKNSPSEQVDIQRKSTKEPSDNPQASASANKIQPEELLDKIKSITQNGAYSVRFQQFKESDQLVVQIFDYETDEVIRQIPAEELLELELSLEELRGNLVNTEA
ncbi:flagellar protein FlaG [Desulfosediminicola flagellatus]|uniref:flagellar protein FlaG n=1 Tax=Desulfosediminicola flagellatus TaxID=2569541 RepID=UPI0010AD49DF|nr:flagellar protein FlaG [Desulfosediminicola flagellatus]